MINTVSSVVFMMGGPTRMRHIIISTACAEISFRS